MALRTRLSLAFVLIVLIPILVGAIAVLIAVPHVLKSQIGTRLRTAGVSVTDVLAARCTQAQLAAQLLGREVATLGPQAAVTHMVSDQTVDYAVVSGSNGAIVASAGKLAGAPAQVGTSTLNSCGDAKNASVAISSRADLAIAGSPQLSQVAVAYSVGSTTAASLRAALSGSTAVTLTTGGALVSSTLTSTQAAKQTAAAKAQAIQPTAASPRVFDDAGRILAFVPPSTNQPYGVIVSERVPDTTNLTLVLAAIVLVTMLARLISGPVVELSEAAARAASGDLDIAIPVRSKDEVGQLATAFNHMTSELQTYIRQLESSRDELRQNLDRLGATLTHTHDLDGILAVVLDTAIGSAQATGGAIMFLDADGNLAVQVRRGEVAESVDVGTVVPIGKGISGHVAATGEPVCGRAGEGPGLRRVPSEPDAASVIAVPLKQSGRIVGVLNLYDKEGAREFTSHDLDTILAFSTQAGVAIDNVLLHQEAQRLSLTDPLTGLWNYRYLTIGLGHEIERASRFSRPLAALMLDLDRFKSINDKYGHQVGDAVLIELAGRMREEVREVDTVSRYGGEEFVIVLPETDAIGAARLAARLGTVIRSTPFCLDLGANGHAVDPRTGLNVTASIGVAVFPEHGMTPSRLLRSADDALYAAKDAGRDGWRFALATEDDGTNQERRVLVVPDTDIALPEGADRPRYSDD
jgi:two-component system cell cycle response regulator